MALAEAHLPERAASHFAGRLFGTVGWEPKAPPDSIEKPRLFSRDCRAFVAHFVSRQSSAKHRLHLSMLLSARGASQLRRPKWEGKRFGWRARREAKRTHETSIKQALVQLDCLRHAM
jgi:hypothetical protein